MLRPDLAVPFLVATAWLAAPASSQEPVLKARDFFFDDYRSVLQFDMKALRDTGVWDEMSGSALKLILGIMEQQFGFTLDRLDRVTSLRTPKIVDGKITGGHEIITIEGNDELGETRDMSNGRYQAEEAGDYTLLRDRWSEDDALVQVTPKLRVYGPPASLRPVLTGKPRAGLPSGEVMSFTAAQKDVLFYFVFDLRYDDEPRKAIREALPDAGWPADDEPTFVCGRLRATGDEDDRHLSIEVILRHGKQGAGIGATEAAVQAWLVKITKMKESRLFRPLLKKIEHQRDGTDAVWRVDLGRARQAIGLFSTMVPFMFVSRAAEVQLEAIEVIEEQKKAPEPPVQKPGKKKKA